MTMLTYRRHAMQSLITNAKPPKVGRPISNTTFLDSQNFPKRHKSNYSVHKSIRLENLGCHWMIYVSVRGRCDVCSQNKVEPRPHSKCSNCGVFLCCNEKKIAFLSIMTFSRLSFKDTMMLGVLNFVEYLQTIVLSKPEKFSFLSFSTLSGLSSPTYSFSRTHAPKKFFWGFCICHSVLKNCQQEI